MNYSDHDDARALTRIERDMAPGLRIDDHAARDAHLNAIETEIRAEDAARFYVHREDDIEFDDDGRRVQGYTVRGRAGYVSGRFYHPALAQALCDDLNLEDAKHTADDKLDRFISRRDALILAAGRRFEVVASGPRWLIIQHDRGCEDKVVGVTRDYIAAIAECARRQRSLVEQVETMRYIEQYESGAANERWDVEPEYLEADGPMESEARRGE